MGEREQNLNREEKTDGMPDVMMEIPADEFSADEFSTDEAPADETPADGVSADEIPAEDISADEIPVDVFPDEQKEEPLTVSSESVTEILMPENKELSSERPLPRIFPGHRKMMAPLTSSGLLLLIRLNRIRRM